MTAEEGAAGHGGLELRRGVRAIMTKDDRKAIIVGDETPEHQVLRREMARLALTSGDIGDPVELAARMTEFALYGVVRMPPLDEEPAQAPDAEGAPWSA